MRHRPALVDAVARKAASQVVVDAAGAHPVQCGLHRGQQGRLARARVRAQHQVHGARVGKLGRALQAAVHRVRMFGQRPRRHQRQVFGLHGLALERLPVQLAETVLERLDVRKQILILPLPGIAQRHDQAREPGSSITVLRRKVGPTEERLPLRRQEDRQRPSAGLPHHLHDFLVDVVDVGPLLPVDLDIDKALVQQARGLRVLEGLVGHYVAPVTGRISDRQVNRQVPLASALERLRAPRIPVDRIVRVLLQIGGRFPGQPIGHAQCYLERR